jgi:DNA-binding NarL/FixJ family response regulator
MIAVSSQPYILIVENHFEFRQAVRRFLELKRVGARMMEASSGEEGVVIAHKFRPKVIIMDFVLRGMNGLEAAHKIKEENPKCHIIMLTMFDSKEIAQVQRDTAIKMFINKENLYDQLIPALDKVL